MSSKPPRRAMRSDAAAALRRHQARLARCRRCPLMQSTPVLGEPALSDVMLVGQAPGIREGELHRPFAWTAGKTLFKWFVQAGMPDDAAFRRSVYMAAVCRCFPGKRAQGGDRVPSEDEIAHCAGWLDEELRLLRPRLVIAAGKLAIREFLGAERLDETVGRVHRGRRAGMTFDVLPLPHPSGASTWIHMEPGKTLLRRALALLADHPAWRALVASLDAPR